MLTNDHDCISYEAGFGHALDGLPAPIKGQACPFYIMGFNAALSL